MKRDFHPRMTLVLLLALFLLPSVSHAAEGETPADLVRRSGVEGGLIVEDPRDLDGEEIARVLVPRGVAFVKTADGWKKQEKPWPDDIDEWPHFLHGADNNAVADDVRVAPPHHVQWVAGPRWARSHDHMASLSAAVSSGGRLFYIVDEGPIASVGAPAKWMLVARKTRTRSSSARGSSFWSLAIRLRGTTEHRARSSGV